MSIYRFLIFFFILSTYAQKRFELTQHSCSYYGEEVTELIYTFKSTNDAKKIIGRIVNSVGLEQNFEIKAANVPNAQAVIKNGIRYILYSQVFMQSIEKNTNTEWSSISILAHEIGHHLNGHTLDDLGSRPDKELEADKFSGYVCFKLGASLEEAQAAMRVAASDNGSSTHPPKSARLEAISNGWYQAKDEISTIKEDTKSSTKDVKKKKKSDSQPVSKRSSYGKGDLCIQNIKSNRSTWGNLRIKLYKSGVKVKEIVIGNGEKNCIYNLDYGIYTVRYSNYMRKGNQEVRIDDNEINISLSNH